MSLIEPAAQLDVGAIGRVAVGIAKHHAFPAFELTQFLARERRGGRQFGQQLKTVRAGLAESADGEHGRVHHGHLLHHQRVLFDEPGEFAGGARFGSFSQHSQGEARRPRPGFGPGSGRETHRGEEQRRFAVGRHHHGQAVGEDAFLSGHARGVRNRVVERRSGRKVRGTFPRGFAPGGFGEGRGRQVGVRAGFVVELPVGQDPDAGPPFGDEIGGSDPAQIFGGDGIDERRFAIHPRGVAVQDGRLAKLPRALLDGEASRDGRAPELVFHLCQFVAGWAVLLEIGDVAVKGAEHRVTRPAQGIELAEIVAHGVQRPDEARHAVVFQAEVLSQEQNAQTAVAHEVAVYPAVLALRQEPQRHP